MSYTEIDILKELDDLDVYKFWLDLEHGYFHTAGSRISLFGDAERWALVFEKTGYGNRASCVILELNYFGNCLINLDTAGSNNQFTVNSKYFEVIVPNELERIQDGFELVSKNAKTIKIRNLERPIEQNLRNYSDKGIEVQEYDNPLRKIDFPALARYLDEENPELFRANKEELYTCLPSDIPLIFKIDNWHHQSYGIHDNSPKPSSYETYKLIAKVLVTANMDEWKPTLKANNNWRNWPEAGNL
jgi:Family of unknown function (DUF7003)